MRTRYSNYERDPDPRYGWGLLAVVGIIALAVCSYCVYKVETHPRIYDPSAATSQETDIS